MSTRDSFFNQWWFFDTNCLSELVKQWRQGHGTTVDYLIGGKDILLVANTLQELRRAPDILQDLATVLHTANTFVVPDITRFWYTDLMNFCNPTRIPINTLNVQKIQKELFTMILTQKEFDAACQEVETSIQNNFLNKVACDIGSQIDERDLCMHIHMIVNRYAQRWLNIEIPIVDCNPKNFPSFYTFFYTYFYRYIKNRVNATNNDFIDFQNIIPLVYCQRFYGEKKITSVLKKHVQGHYPPSAFHMATRMHKMNKISSEQIHTIKRNKHLYSYTSMLLPDLQIFDFSELRQHLSIVI